MANLATQDMRESANFFALTVRSMIAFYGVKNFARVWKIPKPFRKTFMNFLLFETKGIRDDKALDGATRRRFGNTSFSADEESRMRCGWPR
jgi:hypothetical protein